MNDSTRFELSSKHEITCQLFSGGPQLLPAGDDECSVSALPAQVLLRVLSDQTVVLLDDTWSQEQEKYTAKMTQSYNT